MTDEKKTESLTDEELERQEGEQVPDREVMSVISPTPDRPLPLDQPPADGDYPAPLE
jgi:hypothetical protein